MEEYIIVSNKEIIKSYKNFKQAMKDKEFFELIYNDIYVYKLIVDNHGNIIK